MLVDRNGHRSGVGEPFEGGLKRISSFPVAGALELFVIGADGTHIRQLTKLQKVCTPAALSPDGK
jgi:hypothetical protein